MILLVSELVLPTGRLGTTLTDLFPNTQYEITVFAINGAGNGAANIETVTTLNGLYMHLYIHIYNYKIQKH